MLVKLHGGVRSLPGFADLVRITSRERSWVVAIPGTDDLDPELTAYSTAGMPVAHEAKAYFQLGGLENVRQCLYFLSDHLLTTGIGYAPPAEQPRSGVYHPRVPDGTLEAWRAQADPSRPTIGVTFYRAYWLIGDTAFIDTLVESGDALGANVLPVFAYSLKDGDADAPAGRAPLLRPTTMARVDRRCRRQHDVVRDGLVVRRRAQRRRVGR